MTRLRNIGPTSARWLAEVGIETEADLEEVGAVEAYRRVRARQPRASLNLLYALEGALLGLPWNGLPPEVTERLRREADDA